MKFYNEEVINYLDAKNKCSNLTLIYKNSNKF